MTDPATIWRKAMAERAAKREAALAAGKTDPGHAFRDAQLCALFLYICVDLREQDNQFTGLFPCERDDLHAAITIATAIATRASDTALADALWSIARPARAAMTMLHAALDARESA